MQRISAFQPLISWLLPPPCETLAGNDVGEEGERAAVQGRLGEGKDTRRRQEGPSRLGERVRGASVERIGEKGAQRVDAQVDATRA